MHREVLQRADKLPLYWTDVQLWRFVREERIFLGDRRNFGGFSKIFAPLWANFSWSKSCVHKHRQTDCQSARGPHQRLWCGNCGGKGSGLLIASPETTKLQQMAGGKSCQSSSAVRQYVHQPWTQKFGKA